MRFILLALTVWVAKVSGSPFLVRRDTEFLVDRTGWTATATGNTANTDLAVCFYFLSPTDIPRSIRLIFIRFDVYVRLVRQ